MSYINPETIKVSKVSVGTINIPTLKLTSSTISATKPGPKVGLTDGGFTLVDTDGKKIID